MTKSKNWKYSAASLSHRRPYWQILWRKAKMAAQRENKDEPSHRYQYDANSGMTRSQSVIVARERQASFKGQLPMLTNNNILLVIA